LKPSVTAPGAPSARYRFDWRQTFAALKYPNYRLWFIGQLVSLAGTWMQSAAQGYLIYQITKSPVYLGYVSFASGIPTWLFTLYGGVIADRMSRRALMIITQTSMMILAFILAALTFTGVVQPWHILLLAFLLGIAQAFDAPARQAFVLEMVEREDLTNALALNATMFNSAVAVGPAVGGLTYAAFGPGWCFTLNGLSFIAVIVALALMKLKALAPVGRRGSPMLELREVLRYVVHHHYIGVLIAMIGVSGLFGASLFSLFPAWAVAVLHGNETTNGLLLSARGVGALIGALFIASLGRFRFKGRVLTVGTFAFPILMLVFSALRWLPFSLLSLVAVGFAQILTFNLINALVQTQAEDRYRGRVMGVYSLVFFGSMPIGALVAGAIAQQTNEQLAVVLGASVLLVSAVLLWVFIPRIRRLE
jgi:predicted MFS family arabinose efflux permease